MAGQAPKAKRIEHGWLCRQAHYISRESAACSPHWFWTSWACGLIASDSKVELPAMELQGIL